MQACLKILQSRDICSANLESIQAAGRNIALELVDHPPAPGKALFEEVVRHGCLQHPIAVQSADDEHETEILEGLLQLLLDFQVGAMHSAKSVNRLSGVCFCHLSLLLHYGNLAEHLGCWVRLQIGLWELHREDFLRQLRATAGTSDANTDADSSQLHAALQVSFAQQLCVQSTE